MTEFVPVRPFAAAEALAWLRSQAGGSVTASAAELGRQWGWNRVRAGRRLKAWQAAGHIRRDGDTIVVIGGASVAVTAGVTSIVASTSPTARRTKPLTRATLLAALALACVSAAFSIDGLTTIFGGAFWPVVTMGVALEAGKLVATAWLTEHWRTAPRPLRLVLLAMIAMLMALNAVGVFGFLTRAHLDHAMASDLALTDQTADIDARLAVQAQAVADLDRRIGQIDAAIEESTRRGRPAGAMTLADQQRHARADLATARQREAHALAAMQIEKAKVDALRKRAEADAGPVRFLAELFGAPASDLEHTIRLLTLGLVAVLDPLAIALLLAAGVRT
jgi:hypothetical protein